MNELEVNKDELGYLSLIGAILMKGERKGDRTGIGTLSLFGEKLTFHNVGEQFPLLTTKKVAFKAVVSELLWFLEGSTDERRLAELNYGMPAKDLVDKRTIWTGNALEQGYRLYGDEYTQTFRPLGPVYGHQWRNFNGVDQIATVIHDLKYNPQSRRHIVSAWNPSNLKDMALPPCHMMFQFYVRDNEYLDCQLYIRSNDMGLGAPFNIASYSLLMMIIANEVGLTAGTLNYLIGDAHIYTNHIDPLMEQMERFPYPFPTLTIDPKFNLNEILIGGKFELDAVEMFTVDGYNHHPSIKMVMAV
jgi:thymidylate synthase